MDDANTSLFPFQSAGEPSVQAFRPYEAYHATVRRQMACKAAVICSAILAIGLAFGLG